MYRQDDARESYRYHERLAPRGPKDLPRATISTPTDGCPAGTPSTGRRSPLVVVAATRVHPQANSGPIVFETTHVECLDAQRHGNQRRLAPSRRNLGDCIMQTGGSVDPDSSVPCRAHGTPGERSGRRVRQCVATGNSVCKHTQCPTVLFPFFVNSRNRTQESGTLSSRGMIIQSAETRLPAPLPDLGHFRQHSRGHPVDECQLIDRLGIESEIHCLRPVIHNVCQMHSHVFHKRPSVAYCAEGDRTHPFCITPKIRST